MPISDKYKCVFVHVPRTGGTTVEKILGIHREWPESYMDVFHGSYEIANDCLQLQHLPYSEMCQLEDIRRTTHYFKFTIIRNPWDRIVSEYFWQNSNRAMPFDKFAERVAEIVKTRNRLKGKMCHFRPQMEFIGEELDLIIRFENYQDEVSGLFKQLEIQVNMIPHVGKTEHSHYTKYYNERSAELIYNAYREEIKFFNYSF